MEYLEFISYFIYLFFKVKKRFKNHSKKLNAHFRNYLKSSYFVIEEFNLKSWLTRLRTIKLRITL